MRAASRRAPGWTAWLLVTPAAGLLLVALSPLGSRTGLGALGTVVTTQYRLIADTIAYALFTATAATALGWAAAHVLHEYAIPGRRALNLLISAPRVLPSFTVAMGVIVLFGHSGLVTGGIAPQFQVYGLGGLALAGTLSRVPAAYLSLLWAYRQINPELRDAAAGLGASRFLVARTVSWPRLAPSVASSFLFLLGDAFTDLAIPLVIGGGYSTLATRMYEAIVIEGDAQTAAAYALLLTVPAVGLWAVASRLGHEIPDRVGVLSARGRRRPSVWGRALQAVSWASGALIGVLLLAIGVGSIRWGDAGSSVSAYRSLLTGSMARDLSMSLVVALVAAPLAAWLSFGVVRWALGSRARQATTRRALLASSAVPPAVLGLGMYWLLAASASGLSRWGVEVRITAWLSVLGILVVHLVRFVPRVAQPALRGGEAIGTILRDQGPVLGGRPGSLTRVLVWPRVRRQVAGSALAVFADVITAVSSVILLTNSKVPLLPVQMLTDIDAGRLQSASAATVVLIGVVLVMALAHGLWVGTWRRPRRRTEVGAR